MPSRKPPTDWKRRTVALLRAASERGSVRHAAGILKERRPQTIEETIAIAEKKQRELMKSGATDASYNAACRLAADELAGMSDRQVADVASEATEAAARDTSGALE